MSKKIHTILLAFSVLAVFLGGVYFAFFRSVPPKETSQDTASTTPNYTMELDATSTLREIMPNLNRGIIFGASIPEEARTHMQKSYDSAVARLKEDPTRADDWFNLGVYYHAANDYKGAEEVWLFLMKAVPTSAVPYDNLGKMYKFNVKDFPKSESYFMQSMKIDPKETTPYFELFELYRYLYKTDTTAAVDIITEAGKKFPENPDPYTLLGSYYRDLKKYDEARAAFTEGLNRARNLGNVALVDAIGKEIAGLPK